MSAQSGVGARVARPRGRVTQWIGGDSLFRAVVTLCSAVVLVTIVAMVIFLLVQGFDAIRHYGFFSFLTSARWAPSEADPAVSTPNPYGILQFIYGTLVTSFIAMILAVPVAVAVARWPAPEP